MRFDEIERRLGADVVADVVAAVRRAYVASMQSGDISAAEELLIAMLASVEGVGDDPAKAQRRIMLLRLAVKEAREQMDGMSH